MTCALDGGIELVFVRSGVTVDGYEADIRIDRGKFKHASVQLLEEDGVKVAEEHLETEPVHIRLGGERVHRFFIPENAITFEDDYKQDRIARVELYDPIQILQYGNINKGFSGEITIRDVLRDLFSRRNDPNSVFTNIKFTSQDFVSQSTTAINNSTEFLSDAAAEGSTVDDILSVIPNIENRLNKILVENLIGDTPLDQLSTRLDFDHVSPYEAIARVLNILDLGMWSPYTGDLVIGLDMAQSQALPVSESNDIVQMSDYNITEAASRTRGVVMTAEWQLPVGSTYKRPMAQAIAPDVDGDVVQATKVEGAKNLDALERAAQSLLLRRMLEEKNGSITINGLASRGQEQIGKLDIGDYIVVDTTILEKCRENFINGVFVVNSVNHRLNMRQGWRVDVSVSSVDPNIEVSSWKYDPWQQQDVNLIEGIVKDAGGPAVDIDLDLGNIDNALPFFPTQPFFVP